MSDEARGDAPPPKALVADPDPGADPPATTAPAAPVDLEAYARELEAANKALKALDAARSQILSNVSHELRTPLVTIIGYVEMVTGRELGELPDEVSRALEVVLRNSLRLSSLIDDLLNLSRLQVESVEPFVEPFCVGAVGHRVLDEYRLHLEEKSLRVEEDLPDDLPQVMADRRLVRIVLENLVKNAVKFTPPGRTVRLEARADPARGRVQVAVSDTGMGIPEAELARVFEPFYQVDGSPTRAFGGIGAGLAIVRRIIEAHGGQVTIESRVGGGTTVRFDLKAVGGPVAPAADPA